MKKPAKLTVLIAGVAMSTAVAIQAAPRTNHRLKRDAEIIVEVDRSLATLTEEGIINSQKAVESRIAKYVTTNFIVTDRFHVLNNAFVIRVNSGYIDSIKQVPGVKSVTKNEAHWVSEVYDQNDGLYIPLNGEGEGEGQDEDDEEPSYGGPTNYSAVTMNKPGSDEHHGGTTNEGAGTVIAVLDNEFYFRAEHTENKNGTDVPVDSWEHRTFTRLEDSVVKRFDFKTPGTEVEPARGTPAEQEASKQAHLNWIKGTHAATVHPVDKSDINESYDTDPNKAETIANTPLGKEGSLYFNSKVPFYFDYGGEKKVHSDYASFDYDVSSTISYHGSHVASIATGNDEHYKGIAPEAQLVCMKVFCEYKPTEIEEAVGQQAGSYGYDIPILKALEDCIILGVDGINMSLGNSLDDFGKDSITNKTLERLAKGDAELGIEPILTSISAGNDGKASYAFAGGYGNWTFDMVETGCQSGHSNIDEIMGVASGQPTHKFYTTAFKLGDDYIEYDDQIINREGYPDSYDDEHRMADLVSSSADELHWVFVPGFGEKGDYDALDGAVSGNIAIVMRGSTTFVSKYKEAASAGAIGLVIVNNDPTASSFNMRMDFSDEQPTIPVAMVLYGDMPKFGPQGVKAGGDFTIIHDEIGENIREYTLSNFSSDGGTYDLQLKPEIAAPGENIKGAVPPQKKEHKEQSPLSTYEFLSGTSMSAPNYAGAQSVLLSEKAKTVYASANPSAQQLADLYAYRKTIDMRLMSTARPMSDFDNDPELYYATLKAYEAAKAAGVPEEDLPEIIEKTQLTSPRIQGAGMANIGAALSTNVYLEGLATDGVTGLGKSKIELRNNADINQGIINLKFLAHNESESAQTYGATLRVMRPAIKHTNDVLTKEYNYIGEVTSIESFPGRKYYVAKSSYNPDDPDHPIFNPAVEQMSEIDFAHNDVYKVPRDIEYWATEADCAADHPSAGVETRDHLTILPAGKYVNVGDDVTAVWEYAPDYAYQSTQDTEIACVDLGNITIQPGESTITLDSYTLTSSEKAKIAEYFEYGCYLEGYIELESKTLGQPDLAMPYMGFYGGVDENGDYSSGLVVEPFSFEKDPTKIYPSDLVNDLGRNLLGLANVDMGSEWITTYLEPGKSFNDEEILVNKDSLSNLAKDAGYHVVGTDADGNRYADNKIYVGSAEASNTMIIQQFVLRSCMNNFYEIRDSSTNKVVYRGALHDMLYGGDIHAWQLYKSHVDSGFLGGGYLAHRAWGVIPLYDSHGQPFPSGEYTMEFNYILSSTGETVKNVYNLVIDSDTPTVTNLKESGDSIVIEVEEKNLDSLFLSGHDFSNPNPETDHATLTHDYEKNKHTLTIDKLAVLEIMNESLNRVNGYGRLVVGMYDKAYGYAGAVVKFNKLESYKDALKKYGDYADIYAYIPKFNNYTIVESTFFGLNYDIEVIGQTIYYYLLDGDGDPTPIEPLGDIKITNYPSGKSGGNTSKGCGGSLIATSITLSVLSGVLAISLIIATKRKKKEEK